MLRLHRAQPLFQIEFLENRLLLRGIDVQIRREKIDQLFRVVDAENSARALAPEHRAKVRASCAARVAQVAKRRFPFLARRRLDRVEQIDFGAQIRMRLRRFSAAKIGASPCTTATDVIVRLPQKFQNNRRRADANKDPAAPDLPCSRRVA